MDGEKDFVKEGTYRPLVDWLAKGIPVKKAWPVNSIQWQADGAWVLGPGGKVCSISSVYMYIQFSRFLLVLCSDNSVKYAVWHAEGCSLQPVASLCTHVNPVLITCHI